MNNIIGATSEASEDCDCKYKITKKREKNINRRQEKKKESKSIFAFFTVFNVNSVVLRKRLHARICRINEENKTVYLQ